MAKTLALALALALTLALALALTGTARASRASDTDWTTPVHSVPGFRIPAITVTAHDDGVAPGFIFVTPRTIYPGHTGPTILDTDGHVVWFHRQSRELSTSDLRPQVLDGRQVLTWSIAPPLKREGSVFTRGSTPHNNYDVIADSSYHTITHVRAHGHGVITDGHEFLITPRGTAYVLGDRLVHAHLARYGGPERGLFVDNLVQEIDLHTNKVLFDWSAAHHIPRSESTVKPDGGAWDAYHLNSISEDADGNLLVSARHTSTVYKIDHGNGRIIWRLGGRRSDFKFAPGADFYFQHYALRQPDGTLTLFDNHATEFDASHGRSSEGKRLRIDTKSMTVSLVSDFRHPAGTGAATSQGDTTILPNGNAFVGWGISPWFSEYAPDGRLLFAAHFASIWHHSYRAFKGPWVGNPGTPPALAARVAAGRVFAYASWNGATQVAGWRLLGGSDPNALTELVTRPWADFETHLSFPATPLFVRVDALDAAGRVIGRSATIEPSAG